MNRNRTHPLRSSPLRLQRSRVDPLVQPPPIDLDFIKSNEFQYGATYSSSLTPYQADSVTLFQGTGYSPAKSGPGFINSNGLLRMRTSLPGEPRFEFLSPTIGSPIRSLGLNIDVENYNYLQNSSTMSTVAATYTWVATNITGAGTINDTGPDGTTSAITLTSTNSNATITQTRGSAGMPGGPKTFSVWIKRKTGTGAIGIKGSGTTYTTVAVTSEWQRFSIRSVVTNTIPGIQIAQAGDAIYVYAPQFSSANNLLYTMPNELIGDASSLGSGADGLNFNINPTNPNASVITGEVGTVFMEIDMSDRGGTAQYTEAFLTLSDGGDESWYITVARNPLSPGNDSVELVLNSAKLGEWYRDYLELGTLNSILRFAISWDTRQPEGVVSAATWNDTTYPFGIPSLTATSDEITSLNAFDPGCSMGNSHLFYVRKCKMWNQYKNAEELRVIVANG